MLSVEEEKNNVKRRSKGERTRHQILEATIKVLALKGIKGTTHRAIAKAANIQLSLTTYYFKDIEELIHQAIWLNAEASIITSADLCAEILPLLTKFDKAELKKLENKRLIAEDISRVLVDHILTNISDKPEEILVEHILFTQTHLSDELLNFSYKHKIILSEPFNKLCKGLNNKSVELDTEILFTLIKQWQYQQLLATNNQQESGKLYSLIFRAISLLLKIK